MRVLMRSPHFVLAFFWVFPPEKLLESLSDTDIWLAIGGAFQLCRNFPASEGTVQDLKGLAWPAVLE